MIQEFSPPYAVYPEPALPLMGAAGSKVVDPIFDTTILRVTDATTDPSGAGTLYSTYPSVNLNSTRVMGRSNANSNAIFWTLNAAAFTVANRTSYSGNPNVYAYYFVWSGVNPDIVWGAGHANQGADAAKLYSHNVSTGITTLVKDFSALTLAGVPPHSGASLNQMSMSKNDDIFSFTVQQSGGDRGVLVYKRSTDAILFNLTDTNIDETYIDKSGEYLTVIRPGCNATVYRLSTGLSAGTHGMCHNGQAMRKTFCDGGNGMTVWDFVTNSKSNYYGSWLPQTSTHHHSWNQSDETYGLLSGYRDADSNPLVWNAFDNELVLLRLDGTPGVRRVCHTRTNTNLGSTYIASPFGNISPDGQFVAWTSTWGTNMQAGGRIDLYLAKVVDVDVTPPSAPTGVMVS